MQLDEDVEISPFERRIRYLLQSVYRWVLAGIVASVMFDFLFSSVWMHGYIWSLNQKYETDLTDQAAGRIVEHQRQLLPMNNRAVFAVLSVFAVWFVMLCAGFRSSFSVWQHFKLSTIFGLLSGVIRCMQMKQRIYPAIHEGFYVYLMVFVIGMILSAQKGNENEKETDYIEEKKVE